MKRTRKMLSGIGKGAAVIALTGALCVVGGGIAFAADAPFGSPLSESIAIDPDNPDLLTTYGVRAGSAGPDFLGITNTNFDFTAGDATSNDQYTGYSSLASYQLAGLSIWATSVNENVNPYYANLLYNVVTSNSVTTKATTWMSNPVNSWGDSNGSVSRKGNVSTGATTIAGLEFDPEIIFGANKYTNWGNASSTGAGSGTNIFAGLDYSPSPVFTSNDATNIWTQVYTMGQLSTVANTLTDGTDKVTRYDDSDATVSAVNYEKAIRGNLLYIASQIDGTDNSVSKKTVAYLYAIDASGTAYFFTPTASGLLVGDDTGDDPTTAATASTLYASNNSTIGMGYMATLPFITNTFDSGNKFTTTVDGITVDGIIMKVEDIFKASPACTVASTDTTDVLDGVDVIIYNSTLATTLSGTSGGRNSSGVGTTNTPLTEASVRAWADAHDGTGDGSEFVVIAGDDFGTSSNQGYGIADTNGDGMAPLLYCQRNYTADKNARAAWAYAQVYPELYDNNADATYAYWVDKVYHVNTEDVSTVVKYMTNQSDTVVYDGDVADSLEAKFEAGYDWWTGTNTVNDPSWLAYSYYNGSSRASFYSGDPDSEEDEDTIGIFAPSALWVSAHSSS